MPPSKWDLVVIGAGAGGLVLALDLARKGFRIAILDQKPGPAALPRGEILQPNGLNILKRLGLLPALLEADVHLNKSVDFCQLSGAHLCTIDYTRLPAPYGHALILLPEHLQAVLLQQIERSACVDLFWGTSFKGLLRENGRLTGAEGEHRGKRILFRAPVVVGADGAHSRVRSALRIRHRLHTYADGYASMVIDRPAGFKADCRYYLGTGIIFGAFPVSSTRIYLFYLVRARELASFRARGVSHFKASICALQPEIEALFSEPLKEISSWGQTLYMPCFRVRARRWVADGGALIGDAAHAMNPHVAQGRNAAMEDGMALSDVLQSCFKHGDFSRSALRRYESLRRKPVKALQGMGDEMVLLWNAGSPVVAALRDRVFRAVHQDALLHDKLLRTVAGLPCAPFGFADRWRILFPGS